MQVSHAFAKSSSAECFQNGANIGVHFLPSPHRMDAFRPGKKLIKLVKDKMINVYVQQVHNLMNSDELLHHFGVDQHEHVGSYHLTSVRMKRALTEDKSVHFQFTADGM